MYLSIFYLLVYTYKSRANAVTASAALAFTRYCFTSKVYCGRQSSFYPPRSPPPKPTLLQYYCTPNAQYTTPSPTPCLYGIHHTILVMAISCKGQALRRSRRGNPAQEVIVCICIYLAIYLPICLSIYIKLEPTLLQPALRRSRRRTGGDCIHPSIYLSIYLSACLYMCGSSRSCRVHLRVLCCSR